MAFYLSPDPPEAAVLSAAIIVSKFFWSFSLRRSSSRSCSSFRAPLPLLARRLPTSDLTVLEVGEPLVPEISDEARRDLELLDDLAQLAARIARTSGLLSEYAGSV
jgi:hypothetical protein